MLHHNKEMLGLVSCFLKPSSEVAFLAVLGFGSQPCRIIASFPRSVGPCRKERELTPLSCVNSPSRNTRTNIQVVPPWVEFTPQVTRLCWHPDSEHGLQYHQ